NALIAALVGLNMNPMTANTLVTVIQVIASNKSSTPSALPLVHQDDSDNSITSKAKNKVLSVYTPPPITGTSTAAILPTPFTGLPSTTTPVPTAIVEVIEARTNHLPPTNAYSVTLLPTSISYQGFSYRILHTSAEALFYYVTKGKHIGVLSTW
ncbi:hypothetical protein P692DRAFT_20642838, partial [Suillus brevipes Sb2]